MAAEPTGEPGPSLVNDEWAMELAITEAQLAKIHGDVPIGAVAMIDGKVVAARHNERELTHDPTAHAEILLLRDVAQMLGDWRMGAVTLIVTLEPCPMCAGAMVNARVGRLVFGAYDPKAGAVGSLFNLCSDPRLNHELPVAGGVLAERCGALLTSFFEGRRGPGSPTSGDPDEEVPSRSS
jgi:tRNA(adenine34) deaminase